MTIRPRMLRLTAEEAEALETIAGVDEVSIDEEIRRAIDTHIEARRSLVEREFDVEYLARVDLPVPQIDHSGRNLSTGGRRASARRQGQLLGRDGNVVQDGLHQRLLCANRLQHRVLAELPHVGGARAGSPEPESERNGMLEAWRQLISLRRVIPARPR